MARHGTGAGTSAGGGCVWVGDRLVGVNGIPVMRMLWHEIMDLLKAVQIGEVVVLTLRRVGYGLQEKGAAQESRSQIVAGNESKNDGGSDPSFLAGDADTAVKGGTTGPAPIHYDLTEEPQKVTRILSDRDLPAVAARFFFEGSGTGSEVSGAVGAAGPGVDDMIEGTSLAIKLQKATGLQDTAYFGQQVSVRYLTTLHYAAPHCTTLYHTAHTPTVISSSLSRTQDPYVIVVFGNQRQRTGTSLSGGTEPSWLEVIPSNVITVDLGHLQSQEGKHLDSVYQLVRFEIWNENTLEDDLIGTFNVSIAGIFTSRTLRHQLGIPNWYAVDTGGLCQCQIEIK